MLRWVLDLNVMDGPLPVALWIVTALVAVVLLVRDNAPRWVITALPAVCGGAAAGVITVWLCDVADVFGVPLPRATAGWAALAGGGLGLGIVSLWRTHVWRKALAVVLIVTAPLAAAMGVNAGFGLTRTVADVFGISTVPAVGRLPQAGSTSAPTARPTPAVAALTALYQTWKPPADMPKVGRVGGLSGAQGIPITGGFKAREPTLYLPPAALVRNAPALPLVVMMNGKPGWPDPDFVAAALNALAARHRGLAPIVIIADQLGTEDTQQPACSPYSVYGNVSEYFNTDIVDYARTRLNVIKDPRYWTIAGYSDGGACALQWAAEYPDIWGNMVSVSGDDYPGATEPAARLRDGFRGDAALARRNLPKVFLQRNRGQFRGHVAIFTAGALDAEFSGFARSNGELTRQAGFATTVQEIRGATHVGTALSGGLWYAFTQLYPVLGLAPGLR